MTVLLNPRVWLALILAAVLGVSHFTAYRSGRHAVQTAWNADKVNQERAAQTWAARNRDMQRQAEKRYVIASDSRSEFFTNAAKEVSRASAPLAACVLPDAVVRGLRNAAACADSNADSAASCGADLQVR